MVYSRRNQNPIFRTRVRGGKHPALLDAMGHRNCVLANDVPEHREVLGHAGEYFNVRDVLSLSSKIEWMLQHPEAIKRYRKEAVQRVRDHYSWGKVASDYERLFSWLTSRNG
jgi:glycosyltransferase involved in cell wall biosynthesis